MKSLKRSTLLWDTFNELSKPSKALYHACGSAYGYSMDRPCSPKRVFVTTRPTRAAGALHRVLERSPNQRNSLKGLQCFSQEECAQKGLDSSELALHLGWPERVVRRWLLDPNDPDYRAMSERDYQHFLFCLSQLPASSDEINNKSGQT